MNADALQYREATSADVPQMVDARAPDIQAGPADPRMARYLDGEHHPQKALLPRVAYIAVDGESVVGYIGGHRTERYGCDGELQYLYVVPQARRSRVAGALLRLLARWFTEHDASRICVGVDEDNDVARSFLGHQGAVSLDSGFLVWDDIAELSSRG